MKLHGFLLFSILAMAGCTPPSQGTSLTAGLQDPEATPAQAELYLGLVDGIIKQGRYEAAIGLLDRYRKSEEPVPRYQLLRGEALLGARRYDGAAAAFTAALESDFAPQAWNGLGRVEAARGRWNAASTDFSHAADLDPAGAKYLNNLGYAKLQQGAGAGRIVSAKMDLERAYELSPASDAIRNNLILASHLSNDQGKVATLMATIKDNGQRQHITDFIKTWSASHDHDLSVSEGGIQ